MRATNEAKNRTPTVLNGTEIWDAYREHACTPFICKPQQKPLIIKFTFYVFIIQFWFYIFMVMFSHLLLMGHIT